MNYQVASNRRNLRHLAFGAHVMINVQLIWSICVLSLIMIGGCSRGFQLENGKPAIVGWAGERTVQYLDGADPETFQAIDSTPDAQAIYAVDVSQVYIGVGNDAMRIDAADPATFSIVTPDGAYTTDKEGVYWFGVEIPGADPATFKILKQPYVIDAKRAYVGITPLEVRSVQDFQVLEVGGAVRPITNRISGLVRKDPDDAIVSGWSRDGVAYYWGATELKGANYESLTILNDRYAKDKNQVYYKGKRIPGADAESFVTVGPGVIRGRDKQFEYKQGNRVGPAK